LGQHLSRIVANRPSARGAKAVALAWISHTILARLIDLGRFSYFFERPRDAVAPGDAIRAGAFCNGEEGFRWDFWVMPREVTRWVGAGQAGEPRALAAALRRVAAQPQT
jgi:hypothetical protein